MDLSALIERYGYWAVFVGTLAEGETVLIVAGFAAHRGLLKLPEVTAVAFVASALGDQLFFWLGRRHGDRLIARWPAIGAQAGRVSALVSRHPNATVLALRFLYGLRIAGPIALGALRMPAWRFVPLNLLGAALWALLVGGIGWQFGNALQWLLTDLRAVEEGVLLVLLCAGIAWTWWRVRRRG